jgi:hypothetical protein
MAIRPTKQTWDAIRIEYVRGATAAELAQRFSHIKAASIHARATRERWRELPVPESTTPSKNVMIHAKATGISIEEATALEMVEQNRTIARHRAETALLTELLTEGLALAVEASKQRDSEMAKSAASLISSINEVAAALYLKVAIERTNCGLISAPFPPISATFGNLCSTHSATEKASAKLKLEGA